MTYSQHILLVGNHLKKFDPDRLPKLDIRPPVAD